MEEKLGAMCVPCLSVILIFSEVLEKEHLFASYCAVQLGASFPNLIKALAREYKSISA